MSFTSDSSPNRVSYAKLSKKERFLCTLPQPSRLESAPRFRYNLAEMRAFLYYIGYLAVAALWWIYRLLPARCAYGLGWHIGAAAFSLCRGTKRARTAVDNVIVAGLAANRRDAYRIARNALAHFAGHITEALRIHDVITKDNWPEYVTLDMTPAAHEAIFRPTGPIILATGHLGAWEAGIPAFVSARPMMVVARMMDNPYIQRFLERHNFRGGATVLPKKHGFSGSNLRRWTREKGALAILFDQFSSSGVPVSFFGHTVPVYTSPARLHLKTGAPILVGAFLRTGRLRYKIVVIGDPIVHTPTDSHAEDIRAITAELIRRLEQVIRMAPDQYLWLHRRWRGIPVPEVPEK